MDLTSFLIALCIPIVGGSVLAIAKWWTNKTNNDIGKTKEDITKIDKRLEVLENNHNFLEKTNGVQNNDIKNFTKEVHDMTDILLKSQHSLENALKESQHALENSLKDQFRQEINEIKKDFVSVQQFNSLYGLILKTVNQKKEQ